MPSVTPTYVKVSQIKLQNIEKCLEQKKMQEYFKHLKFEYFIKIHFNPKKR